jgi:hypothetical protein
LCRLSREPQESASKYWSTFFFLTTKQKYAGLPYFQKKKKKERKKKKRKKEFNSCFKQWALSNTITM